MDWKSKLTSRKFWASVVSFVALLVVALGGTETQATQITALIMAGATVIAYIVGEGMIDAASAGAQASTQNSTTVIGTAGASASEGTPTGAAQAAEFKTTDNAYAAFPGLDNVTAEQIDTAIQAANIMLSHKDDAEAQTLGKEMLTVFSAVKMAKAATSESGAVASDTTGAV